jgi:hypothetical protein
MSAAKPAASCQALNNKGKGSGFYYLKGKKNSKAFEGYCENEKWDGGWLMILNGAGWKYKQQWKKTNQRKAYGGIPSPKRYGDRGPTKI